MRWSEVIDEANPENVPRTVHYRDQSFMPLEPCSAAQQTYLLSLMRETGVKAGDLYGDGFTTVEALSSWAASWGIEQLLDARAAQEADEQDLKRMMGAIMRERMQAMPVRRCQACDGDRPFRVDESMLRCTSCGGRP